MLPRAGRFTGALLRPSLRLGGDISHVRPLVPQLALSAQPFVPASPCLTQMSCRCASSQAKERTNRQEVDGKGAKTQAAPAVKEKLTSAEQIGTLVKAGHGTGDPRHISLEFEKLDAPVMVPKLWLRDACQCHLCVSESSGQKRFATCDLSAKVEVDSLRVLEDGALEVSWANDPVGGGDRHLSTYPLDVLQVIPLTSDPYRQVKLAREIWDSKHFDKDSQSREISYGHWMEDGSLFAEAFRNLYQWGLVVIRGVPQTEDAVEQVASRLGHLQATLYGPTWDVVSKPRAENVAYTNEFLCLHQDLMYLEDPPRIQVLHCLENGCEGGDSLFSDGIRAAYELKIRDKKSYYRLGTGPVDFHYARGGHYWHRTQRTIQINVGHPRRPPQGVRWSPPFQAPFWTALNKSPSGSTGPSLNNWQRAAQAFRDSIEKPPNMVQFRLQPGDCVVFDNWRVLHGRRAFDTASGRRHLRGTYVESGAFKSTWLRLQREGLMPPDEPRDVYREEGERARRILGHSEAED